MPATTVRPTSARPARCPAEGRSRGGGSTLLRNLSASAMKANGTGSRRRNMGLLLLERLKMLEQSVFIYTDERSLQRVPCFTKFTKLRSSSPEIVVRSERMTG